MLVFCRRVGFDVAENTFIYDRNLGDHVRNKIRLMKNTAAANRVSTNTSSGAPPEGLPWPKGFPTK